HAKRLVDAQGVGGLAEPDARNVEGRAPLDQEGLDAAPGEGGGGRQPADAAADHEDASNFVHRPDSFQCMVRSLIAWVSLAQTSPAMRRLKRGGRAWARRS